MNPPHRRGSLRAIMHYPRKPRLPRHIQHNLSRIRPNPLSHPYQFLLVALLLHVVSMEEDVVLLTIKQ